MRKTHLFTGLLAVAGALAVGGRASADLIINGDFSAGYAGFTSGYIDDSSAGAGATAGANGGAGYFGIVTDSTYWHPSFTDFHDHTTGTGNMMIVNGAVDSGGTVWSESRLAVVTGDEYAFSFWAASAYTVSPADLDITLSINGTTEDFVLPTTAGTWGQYTMDFIANSTPTTITIIDSNTASSGNDFALDDITLNPVTSQGPVVPLPASALSGSILLAGVAIANQLRRRRQA